MDAKSLMYINHESHSVKHRIFLGHGKNCPVWLWQSDVSAHVYTDQT